MYFLPNVLEMIKTENLAWAGDIARIGEVRNTYRMLVGKHQWKRPLDVPLCGWEDNIKTDFTEVASNSTRLIWLETSIRCSSC